MTKYEFFDLKKQHLIKKDICFGKIEIDIVEKQINCKVLKNTNIDNIVGTKVLKGKKLAICFNNKYMWMQDKKQLYLISNTDIDYVLHFYKKGYDYISIIKKLAENYKINLDKETIVLYSVYYNECNFILRHFKVIDINNNERIYETNIKGIWVDDNKNNINNINNTGIYTTSINNGKIDNKSEDIVWEYLKDGKLYLFSSNRI